MGNRPGAEAVKIIVGFRWFVEVCNAYENLEDESASEVDFGSAEEIFSLYQISKDDACGFAIYGYETQGQFNFEDILSRAAGLMEKWREQALFYRGQLMDQYKIVMEAAEKLEKQLMEK